ncbi:hypothetical protein GJ496_003166 [Pomphorhynchus laevis]|nr:hypothetical protein GJ496_003166 [Pomphorhynchus laevis]
MSFQSNEVSTLTSSTLSRKRKLQELNELIEIPYKKQKLYAKINKKRVASKVSVSQSDRKRSKNEILAAELLKVDLTMPNINNGPRPTSRKYSKLKIHSCCKPLKGQIYRDI